MYKVQDHQLRVSFLPFFKTIKTFFIPKESNHLKLLVVFQG